MISLEAKSKPGFGLYLLFMISWFLHMGTRLPFLGTIRFDLILVLILFSMTFVGKSRLKEVIAEPDKWLRILIGYAILTIPFVEWPGSVIKLGLETLIKAAVFYYFTIAFVDSESRLKTFVTVFVGCQLFRVMEPLYLNLTEDYWGAFASMADWEYLTRLSGAPSDIINPNGLAFVICTVLPFLYFGAGISRLHRLAFLVFTPLCIYALTLTGSRSGFLGLIFVALGIAVKAKRRLLVVSVCVVVAIVGFPLLPADMQDRYLSIFVSGTKNDGTAEGRTAGVINSFEVALRKPLFGHGLGTSREANANFAGEDMPAHNLYAEAAMELGFIGMIIFMLFMKSIYTGFRRCKKAFADIHDNGYLSRVVDAMQVWLLLNIIFSFASYGVTSYEWYLLGGMSVVLMRFAGRVQSTSDGALAAPLDHTQMPKDEEPVLAPGAFDARNAGYRP